MQEYDSRPTKCPDCGGIVRYGLLRDFGLREYGSGYGYLCEKCGAYIGTHRKNPKEALGRMTSRRDIKKLRIQCHREEDRHYNSSNARNMLRYVLSQRMGISKDNCHFGYMNAEELEYALNIMKSWKNIHFDDKDALKKLKDLEM